MRVAEHRIPFMSLFLAMGSPPPIVESAAFNLLCYFTQLKLQTPALSSSPSSTSYVFQGTSDIPRNRRSRPREGRGAHAQLTHDSELFKLDSVLPCSSQAGKTHLF